MKESNRLILIETIQCMAGIIDLWNTIDDAEKLDSFKRIANILNHIVIVEEQHQQLLAHYAKNN